MSGLSFAVSMILSSSHFKAPLNKTPSDHSKQIVAQKIPKLPQEPLNPGNVFEIESGSGSICKGGNISGKLYVLNHCDPQSGVTIIGSHGSRHKISGNQFKLHSPSGLAVQLTIDNTEVSSLPKEAIWVATLPKHWGQGLTLASKEPPINSQLTVLPGPEIGSLRGVKDGFYFGKFSPDKGCLYTGNSNSVVLVNGKVVGLLTSEADPPERKYFTDSTCSTRQVIQGL